MSNKTYVTKHESIAAFSRYLDEAGTARRYDSAMSSINTPASHKWSMGVDYYEALQMGLAGGLWDAGAKQLQAVSIDKAAQSIADIVEPAIINDVTGGGIDMGEYLNDSPECFFRLEEEEHPRPIVSLGVCTVPCANIPAHGLMNHGRAIIALVEALELEQYSVELVSMFIAHDDQSGTIFREEVTIKKAGEPWNPSTVAFALAHPAFSRRLGFRGLELDKDCAFISNRSYGDGRISKPGNYDLYFGYLDKPQEVDTPEKALNYVTKRVKAQQPELIRAGA